MLSKSFNDKTKPYFGSVVILLHFNNIDLKKIEEHIYELLFKHDCVTLPEFGGFICQYTSTQFSEEQNTFSPPSKTISFNKHISNDDGLLTHDIANNRNINYAEASDCLKAYIKSLKLELEENQRVELSKLGILFLDNDNNLKFIAEDNNFSTASFGLPTIKALKVQKVEKTKVIPLEPKEEIITTEESTPIIPINQKVNRKSNWWVAAVLLPILFYSAWIPMKTDLLNDSTQFHYSDLNPFTFQKNKKYKINTITKVDLTATESKSFYSETIQKIFLDDSIYLWVDNRPSNPAAERETTYVETKQVEFVETIDYEVSYHLIGGCFGSEQNATNLVSQLTELGYTAKILDKNKGLFRVSIGQFTKRKTAKKQKEKLKSDYDIGSWILKK